MLPSFLRRLLWRACLAVFVFVPAFSSPALAQSPVGWWKAEGNTADSAGGNNGILQGGVGYAPGKKGRAFSFDGTKGVVHIPDSDNLKFTKSFTITAYIFAKANKSGIIFFRGDDRKGLDPYGLGINPDGTVSLSINDEFNNTAHAQSGNAVPLNRWVFVCGSLDDATGKLTLSFDGHVVGQTTTSVRPFRDLDPNASPGISIGNLQDPGTNNYPFYGLIDEVKVYNTAISPRRYIHRRYMPRRHAL